MISEYIVEAKVTFVVKETGSVTDFDAAEKHVEDLLGDLLEEAEEWRGAVSIVDIQRTLSPRKGGPA